MIPASAVTALGVEEKVSGRYGHGKVQLRGFAGGLMPSLNVVAFRGARQRAGGNRALSGARGPCSFGQEQRRALRRACEQMRSS